MLDEPCAHPAFPQPEASVTLWRYMNAEKFQWLLEHGRLFMPAANRLGDPLEGTCPHGELEWWRRASVDAENDEKRRILDHNHAFKTRIAQALRDNYFVSCWHMNECENEWMWDCYTSKKESVAVKTDYDSLRKALSSFVNLGVVRYLDYADARLPTMNMFEYIMHKDSYYRFEREVRAVGLWPTVNELGRAAFYKDLFESEAELDFLVFAPIVDLTRLIRGVVLHPEAPAAFAAEVRDLCLTKGLPQPERSRNNRPAKVSPP